ncbi:hypothetical protein HYT58_03195 [Candidatus Woesearchaeota archaeon]|nr:hypothetical protein [Candidatus Woesearchaeota archaeon]
MKKRVILAVLLVFFVIGCEQFRSSEPKQAGAFLGGTQGVDFAFAEDQPPLQILDAGQQEFFITLILTNGGEYTIPSGGLTASLSGIAREALGLSNLNVKSNFILDGASKGISQQLPGGIEELEFGKANYKPDLPADLTLNLRADVCYDYETNAITKLCLRKNVLQRSNLPEVCDVENQALMVENSGAPLQVRNLQARPVGVNKIRMTFDVVNVGKGLVYAPGAFSNYCGGAEDKKDQVIVTTSIPSGSARVSCSRFTGSSGQVKLVNNIKTVTCDLETSGLQDTPFEDLLKINLKYVYRDAISAPVSIKNSVYSYCLYLL